MDLGNVLDGLWVGQLYNLFSIAFFCS